VFGLDEHIAGLGSGGGIALALLVALLLGLRHATDPDHLTAVTTLVMSDERHGGRRASVLGLFWGLGHAVTLFALGLPIVLFGSHLPAIAQRLAEVMIGLLIVFLAVRLLVRWRRGYFHAHPHRHGDLVHAHPHVHEGGPRHAEHAHLPAHTHPAAPAQTSHADHEHRHADALGRSPLASFGIGLMHGVGGSAGAGVLLIAATPGPVSGALALAVLAAGTAVAMAVCSSGFGYALARRPVAHRLATLVPAFAALGLAFGVWYALGALQLAPYAF
jgi:ABC-type nickel/cobalt efflux system permease component RcnA